MSETLTSKGKRVLAAMVCGAALLASGCGSDNEGKDIPRSSVADLKRSLDSIQRRFELGDGACRDITQGSDTDVEAVRAKIDALPANVDKDVRDALEKSFQHLFDLVDQKCSQAQTSTETTPTETTPTVTQTTPTVTQTVPTTETTPTQTATTPTDNQGNQGQGNGTSGKGNGGGGARAPKKDKGK